jgi:hypothetical protein
MDPYDLVTRTLFVEILIVSDRSQNVQQRLPLAERCEGYVVCVSLLVIVLIVRELPG